MATTHGSIQNTGHSCDITQVWRDFSKTHDDVYRNQLIEYYMHLVVPAAQRLRSRLPKSVELNDMVSAGNFGLMDAIKNFDPDKKVKFETFCSKRIKYSIIDWLRKMDRAPRLVRDRARKWSNATQSLEAHLGRKPTDEEIAKKLKVKVVDIERIKKDANTTNLVSLDNKLDDDDGGNVICEIAFIEDKKSQDPMVEAQKKDFKNLFTKCMTSVERLIFVLYYYEEMSMKDVGLALGISESRVSQIHTSIMKRLKARLSDFKKELIIESGAG